MFVRSFKDKSELQSNTYFVFTYPDLCIVEGKQLVTMKLTSGVKFCKGPKAMEQKSKANTSPTPREKLRTGANIGEE